MREATIMTAQVAAAPQLVARPTVAIRTGRGGGIRLRRQVSLQLICILITATVLFPIAWIVSMAIDPRNISRPDGLDLIPPGASFDAFATVIAKPTQNPVSFVQLALNSVLIAVLIAAASVAFGVLAAYAFSRLRFRGREILMIAIL